MKEITKEIPITVKVNKNYCASTYGDECFYLINYDEEPACRLFNEDLAQEIYPERFCRCNECLKAFGDGK